MNAASSVAVAAVHVTTWPEAFQAVGIVFALAWLGAMILKYA